jgi:hypothetical protein
MAGASSGACVCDAYVGAWTYTHMFVFQRHSVSGSRCRRCQIVCRGTRCISNFCTKSASDNTMIKLTVLPLTTDATAAAILTRFNGPAAERPCGQIPTRSYVFAMCVPRCAAAAPDTPTRDTAGCSSTQFQKTRCFALKNYLFSTSEDLIG